MPDSIAASEALNSVRAAVAADVANVTAAIDTAIADIDSQLAALTERRADLESTLEMVNEQIAAVSQQRETLVAVRDQVSDGARAEAAEPAVAEEETAVEEEDTAAYDGQELDLSAPRTERIAAILSGAGREMNANEIAEILNEHGDDTTPKVVGGTLSNLLRRGVVSKVGPGTYVAAG